VPGLVPRSCWGWCQRRTGVGALVVPGLCQRHAGAGADFDNVDDEDDDVINSCIEIVSSLQSLPFYTEMETLRVYIHLPINMPVTVFAAEAALLYLCILYACNNP